MDALKTSAGGGYCEICEGKFTDKLKFLIDYQMPTLPVLIMWGLLNAYNTHS